MPYRSQFITATDDPLLHPPTRNAANPPHTLQHRFLSCDHPTAHQPHHRPRSPYPAGKPKTPLSLLPLLRSPARPPASSFTLHHTPPSPYPPGRLLALPTAPSIPHHHPVPAAFLLRARSSYPGVNPQTRRLPPHLCYPARERSPPPPALPGLRPPTPAPPLAASSSLTPG